jgi:uncharacterized protein (DUF362 family)
MDRRKFLELGAVAAGGITASTLLLNLSGCGGDSASTAGAAADAGSPGSGGGGSDARAGDADAAAADASAQGPQGLASGEVLLGLYPSSSIPAPEDAVAAALADLDLSWLNAGDSVFVKLVCNSGNPHPAVTAPAAITGLCRALFERGAGRVVVGDQSGVEYVRLAPGEQRHGSTRALMERNGLYEAIVAADAEPHFFDDHGYEAGYFEATLPDGHYWAEPMMIPNIVEQVDHIVYLPRLSSHTLAGYTHGLKGAVGWLRDDSRYHMHNDAASIHEKYTEISYCTEIASRLRLVLTFAEAMMLHVGPDVGTVAVADPRIVIASNDIAHHDALGVALLRHIDTMTPVDGSAVLAYRDGGRANAFNRAFVASVVENETGIPWGGGGEGYTALTGHQYWEGIAGDRGLSRAYALQGGVPESIRVRLAGAALDPAARTAIEGYDGGLFELG